MYKDGEILSYRHKDGKILYCLNFSHIKFSNLSYTYMYIIL